VTYDVDRNPSALRDLAAIWNAAPDRGAVRTAADEIDRLLERGADRLGESREENFRVHLLKPLGVEFQVFVNELRAQVVRVWRFTPRSGR
jgi:hypothetical protein